MFRRIEDFVQSCYNEAEATLKIFEAIPEEVKSKKIHEDVRTLERLAWHITSSNSGMLAAAGIKLKSVPEETSTPASLAQIIEIYRNTNSELAEAVAAQWQDAVLEDEVEMYGDWWSKGKTLYIMLAHQNHHVSQMTIIMRVLGIKVPGTWGPSKEEWAQFGMPAQV